MVAGIFVTTALVLGHDDANSVWLAIASGLAVSIPVTFMATGRLIKFTASQQLKS